MMTLAPLPAASLLVKITEPVIEKSSAAKASSDAAAAAELVDTTVESATLSIPPRITILPAGALDKDWVRRNEPAMAIDPPRVPD